MLAAWRSRSAAASPSSGCSRRRSTAWWSTAGPARPRRSSPNAPASPGVPSYITTRPGRRWSWRPSSTWPNAGPPRSAPKQRPWAPATSTRSSTWWPPRTPVRCSSPRWSCGSPGAPTRSSATRWSRWRPASAARCTGSPSTCSPPTRPSREYGKSCRRPSTCYAGSASPTCLPMTRTVAEPSCMPGNDSSPPRSAPESKGLSMVDLTELLADLDAESSDLDRTVAGLSDVDWSRPTPAQGWTIAHQVSHLAWTDQAALLAVTDPEAFTAQLAWAHAQDVYESLGLKRGPTDRLRHVAYLGYRTFGHSFAAHGRPVPDVPVRVELTEPDLQLGP